MTMSKEDSPAPAAPRLDSWKSVAAYLDRDERTVRRWERDLGLPIRRVAGTRGSSVFAYPAEIDAWLNAAVAPAAEAPVAARPRWLWIAAGLAMSAGALAAAWRMWPGAGPPVIHLTPEAIVATSVSGDARWQRLLPPGERTMFTGPALVTAGSAGGVIVPISDRMRRDDDTPLGGRVLEFDRAGRPGAAVDFDDRLVFGEETYGPPWVLTDFRMDESGGRRRFAAALHQYWWWPSFVTVLDEHLNRIGTFVNAGWIEQVRWLSPSRLVVAGFSTAFDAGVVAVLDASALSGRSPIAPDTTYDCASCGDVATGQYVLLPRTEVNAHSPNAFNRASIDAIEDGRILIRTSEVPADGKSGAAEVFYEFTSNLDLVRASFNDRYWDIHRSLEAQGVLSHSRAACPDHAGPAPIRSWGPAGWQSVSKTAR